MEEINKKLLFFLPSVSTGGAESHIVRLANDLVNQKGYTIYLALARPNGKYEYKLDSKINIIYLQKTFTSSTLSLVIATVRLIFFLRKVQPDLIIGTLDIINSMLYVIKRFINDYKFVFIVQNSPLNTYKGIKRKILFWFINRMYNQSVLNIALSEGVKNEYINNFSCSNGARWVKIFNCGHEGIKEKRYTSKAREETIVACGRLAPQKGFDLLIEAFSKIHNNFPNYKLVVLGEGSLLNELRHLAVELKIENKVVFKGWVKEPSIEFLKAKVFILSSRFEGFGNVVTEAAACGLPIISTNCPHGPSEILKNGKYGILVNSISVEGIASALSALLQNQKQLNVWGKLSLERAKDFSIKNIASQYNKEFTKLLD